MLAIVTVTYEWRGGFDNTEVNALHAECFNHRMLDDDWTTQVQSHSLGWVCARDQTELVGFVNVAWDGAVHAFIIDTMVAEAAGRHGVGTALIARAVAEARARWMRMAARRLRRSVTVVLLRGMRIHTNECGLDRAVRAS